MADSDDARHVKINTRTDLEGVPTSLERACTTQQAEGFTLLRVVYHHDFESIAVFVREVNHGA